MKNNKIVILRYFMASFVLFIGVNLFLFSEAQGKGSNAKDAYLSIEAWDSFYDKEFDKAIELFNKEISLHKDWCDGYDGLGWSYLQKGDFKKAEEYFKKALDIYPYHQNSLAGMAEVDAWRYRKFNRAWGYYYEGNFDNAIEVFNAVLSEEMRLPEAEFWRARSGLGWSYFGKKDYDKAISEFNEVLKAQKDNFDSLKGLGLAYFEKGDLDKALTNLLSSLKAFSYQPDVHIQAGWIYNKKADFGKAIAEFEEAEKLNPYLAEPYKGLAWSYFDMQDYIKAKEAFIQGIKIYPGYIADEKFKEILKTRQDWKDIYKLLAWSYYNYGLYQQSTDEATNALNELGEDAEILRTLGYSLLKLGKYDDAINYLQRSLKKDPDLPPVQEYVQIPGTVATYLIKSDANSSLGWALYFKGKYSDAAAQFQGVLNSHPEWIDVNDGLGWAYFMMKDYKNAENSFKETLNLNPSYADALNGLTAISQSKYGKSGLGWDYYYRGDYKTALEQFKDVLRGKGSDFPKDQLWSISNGMGWCYYWLEQLNESEKEFRLVLNEKKDNVDALVGLGYVLFQKKRYKEALNNLEAALKIVPSNYDALTTLGWSYYRSGEFVKAIDEFKQAIAINPYLVDPYLGLGLSYYENKNYSEAKETIAVAIDIYPDYVIAMNEVKEILKRQADWLDIYNRLGWSYYYKGLFEKASNMFAAMLNKDTSSKDALLGLGSIYFQQGDYKTAINKLEPLLSTKPQEEKGWYKWSYVLNNLGWSYFYSNNYDKALNYFKQVLALHPNEDIYAEPYSGIGWCLLKKGDKNKAKEQFLKAVKLVSGYISALNGLAELDKV